MIHTVVEHSELVEAIGRRGDLDKATAEAALTAVIATLAHGLTAPDRDRLAAALPAAVEEAALVPGRPEHRPPDAVMIELAQRLDTGTERARHLAQAVLAALEDTAPGTGELLRAALDVRGRDVSARGRA